MKQFPIEPREGDLVRRPEIKQLVCLADEALVTGDNRTCLAIVETIYDLLDRQAAGAGAAIAGTEQK